MSIKEYAFIIVVSWKCWIINQKSPTTSSIYFLNQLGTYIINLVSFKMKKNKWSKYGVFFFIDIIEIYHHQYCKLFYSCYKFIAFEK